MSAASRPLKYDKASSSDHMITSLALGYKVIFLMPGHNEGI